MKVLQAIVLLDLFFGEQQGACPSSWGNQADDSMRLAIAPEGCGYSCEGCGYSYEGCGYSYEGCGYSYDTTVKGVGLLCGHCFVCCMFMVHVYVCTISHGIRYMGNSTVNNSNGTSFYSGQQVDNFKQHSSMCMYVVGCVGMYVCIVGCCHVHVQLISVCGHVDGYVGMGVCVK